VIRDVRLAGEKPKGDKVLEVDQNTPLNWPVLWLSDISKDNGGDVYLKIMAHGIETKTSQGGYGIWFCKEGINLTTLEQLKPLFGKVKKIDLLACGAAYITPGCEGKEGDGNLLCYRLAQVTGAYVRASTATQLYTVSGDWAWSHDPLDFGPWEGTVLTYGPTGGVVKVEHAPSS
jgi:hypothetical protein